MTRIEDLLPPEWPPEVTVALEAWHQGQLIEKPAYFWEANPQSALLPFTKDYGDSERESQIFSLPAANRPPYGVIISQTCDICEANPANPFINVAPVVNLNEFDQGKKQEVQRHKFVDFVYLTSQPQPDGFYVADLRVFFPVEKGALAVRKPIEGFASEGDRLDFADRVASRLRRPAFADAVQENLVTPLNKWIRDTERAALREGSGRFTDVEEVRLRIVGDRLSPRSVQLVVFQESELDRVDKGTWRDWRNSNKKNFRKATGIDLNPVYFTSLTKMNARDYRLLAPVWLSNLGRGAQF